MTTSDNKISKVTDLSKGRSDPVDALLALRSAAPASEALSKRIIDLTRNQPQQVKLQNNRRYPLVALFDYFKTVSFKPVIYGGVTISLVFAIMSGPWLIPQLKTSGSLLGQPIHPQQVVDSGLVELGEDFSWEALWILEDELAFSEL
jgi:hypothetical protein